MASATPSTATGARLDAPAHSATFRLSPQAFVREIRYQLDSFPGTNKSQFCFGNLALLTLLGILDVWRLCFMVPEHTKFLPDDIARQIAGVFNANDTFNQGMLLDWEKSCATGVAYDDNLLRTCKSASQLLFNAVPEIMKHSYFWIVGDDSRVELQAGDDGCVDEAELREAIDSLKERSLMQRVLPAVLDGTYNGVGSGALGRVSAEFLVSRSAAGENFRSVRLFMKETEADTRLYEVSGWCKVGPDAIGVETVCKALELVRQISEESLTKCTPYGQKQSN
jgi:hypothetical protein